MTDPTMTDAQLRDALLDATLDLVPFEGWSEKSFGAAIGATGVDPTVARALFPRGAVDLALAYHDRGDAEMVRRLKAADLSEVRFRDRIKAAVQFRIEAISDKEAARRGATLFSLPGYAPDGAKAIWGTADLIWETLGDKSDDYNWYTKRATLSGVYSATLLYWLGDDSSDHQRTWRFLDRRIDDVMQIEKLKSQVDDNPLLKSLMIGPNWVLGMIKPPSRMPKSDLPGSLSRLG
ncbi:MAG: COQ9 family protein [Pseudomonadota bacterium]